jgi:lipopolysaccharide transport system permease protein
VRLQITPSSCHTIGKPDRMTQAIDRARISFIVRSKFRKSTKRRFLGYMWLVLDPFIISMIYLFVFSVVKSNPNAASILIGVTMYRVFQSSLQKGMVCIRELNGGFKAERISTKVVISAEIYHRLIDIFLQTILIMTIMILAFDTQLLAGIIFVLLAQLMGFMFFGLGVIISPLVNQIPDLQNVISYMLRLGFYVSPAMYPMERMEGLHYRINEFNPFSYFAEFARYLTDVDSAFTSLNLGVFLGILSLLSLFTYIGLRRIDKLRWRMTTWS